MSVATRAVVPYSRPSCCASKTFSTAIPAQLTPHMSADEFVSSISRINAANTAGIVPNLVTIFGWLLYCASLSLIIRSQFEMAKKDSDAPMRMYAGSWGTLILAIVVMIIGTRWAKSRREAAVTTAVLNEHNAFIHRGIAFRVISPGERNSSIEVDVLGHPNQPINQAVDQPAPYQPYFVHPPQNVPFMYQPPQVYMPNVQAYPAVQPIDHQPLLRQY